MPKLGEMYPSAWFKAADVIDGELTLTIKRIALVKLGPTDEKWSLFFRETTKGLVLNKTNATAIARQFGDDSDRWMGRQITLYATDIDFQGSTVAAIRVRPVTGARRDTVAQPQPLKVPTSKEVFTADIEDNPF
jgi:hypothetical protein